MTTLNIDIETYSSYDIRKTGVYRYVEAPDFEILIIAFSIDRGKIQTIDMYDLDHDLYKKFRGLLFDPGDTKYAFNANFERTCLAKHFDTEMPPSEWVCTMVNSARAGLPLSLEMCAEVLGIDMQKDAKGKNLIKYFSMPCKPTKVNGGRTRNYPEHDTEKWQQFIDYCEQDVRVEMAIANEISNIEYPDSEQQLWTIDQRINDRGVHIDEALMLGAYKLDEISKSDLMKQAKQLTGL
ncbi:MAG: ribonuclease H-like domain-containing protein, partial [Alteromonadaceae bacterium]|nr:ribonuclease H-like domain-containing protein [Alteromonadaceae bacterium]